jgi:hypothetical protein
MALNFHAVMRKLWVDGLFSREIAKHGSQVLPHLITALLSVDEVSQKNQRYSEHLATHGLEWTFMKKNRHLGLIKIRVELASSRRKEALERYHSSLVDAINRKSSPMSHATKN